MEKADFRLSKTAITNDTFIQLLFPHKPKAVHVYHCLLVWQASSLNIDGSNIDVGVCYCCLASAVSAEIRVARRHGAFTPEALVFIDRYDHQSPYSISLEHRQALSERLREGMSIIVYNANRLRDLCHYSVDLNERY